MQRPAFSKKNHTVVRGFDLLAPFYSFLSGVAYGKCLKKAQLALLEDLPFQGEILICGGGNSALLPALLKLRPDLKIHWCDFSEVMIAGSRDRVVRELGKDSLNQVQFYCCDVFNLPDNLSSFDAVVTQFFLDCFEGEELRRLLSFLEGKVKPESLWLLTDFNCRSFRGRLHSRFLYLFFRCVCALPAGELQDYWQLLEERSWREMQVKKISRGLFRASLMKYSPK